MISGVLMHCKKLHRFDILGKYCEFCSLDRLLSPSRWYLSLAHAVLSALSHAVFGVFCPRVKCKPFTYSTESCWFCARHWNWRCVWEMPSQSHKMDHRRQWWNREGGRSRKIPLSMDRFWTNDSPHVFFFWFLLALFLAHPPIVCLSVDYLFVWVCVCLLSHSLTHCLFV